MVGFVGFDFNEIKKKKLKIDKNKLILHIFPLPSDLELKIVSGGPKGTEIIAETKGFKEYSFKSYQTGFISANATKLEQAEYNRKIKAINNEVLKEYKEILKKYKSGKYRIHVYLGKFEVELLE